MVYCKSDIQTIPGFSTTVQDTVGAGDAFGAAFLHGFHRGWPITVAARFANALGSIVAGRAGATPDWTVDECLALDGMTRREFDAS
jgi:fructokinase